MGTCVTCRYHLVYRCPCVKNHCKVKRPEYANGGQDCPRYTPRKEG